MSSIAAYVTETEYTAYGVSKVLNAILRDAGLKEVRPQMMYNYLRNGLLVKGEKIFGENLRNVTNEEVLTFVGRYVERNKIVITVGEPTNPDQLELDLESVTTK